MALYIVSGSWDSPCSSLPVSALSHSGFPFDPSPTFLMSCSMSANCEFATERIEVAQPSIDGNDAFGVFWFSIGLCLALPSMVVAWTSEHV